MSTIKRGTRFTLPVWAPRRRGDRRTYATVTRVSGNRVWTDLGIEFQKTILERYAEVSA